MEFESDDEGNYVRKEVSDGTESEESDEDASGDEEDHSDNDETSEIDEVANQSLPTGELEVYVPPNYDEYNNNSDTSDEEDIRNTVGNIPMHWYDEYKHIGYDWDAKQIGKPGLLVCY